VSGNRLINASGHAILLSEDLIDVAIEENHIELVRRFGIGTLTDVTALRGSSISRNRVRTCQGNVPTGSLQFGGAIVIGESRDVRLIDNVIAANTPLALGAQLLNWFAVYLEDAEGVEISGNTIAENATGAGLGGFLGAIGLNGVRGVIRIQNNIVRENGGIALLAVGQGHPAREVVAQVLVQNNHFSEGPNPSFFLVAFNAIDSLLFQGNQCRDQVPHTLPTIWLSAARANVIGNVIDAAGSFAIWIAGEDLIVSTNSVRTGDRALAIAGIPLAAGPVRVVVTSNLTTGIVASSTGVLIRASNFPPP
jgi:hypothetical protein